MLKDLLDEARMSMAGDSVSWTPAEQAFTPSLVMPPSAEGPSSGCLE